MKLAIAAACLAASLGLASHALADTQIVATLQQPLAKKVDFIAEGVMWQCAGNACSSIAPEQTMGVDQCRSIALKVGPVAEVKDDAKSLDAASLDRCNAGIASKVATAR